MHVKRYPEKVVEIFGKMKYNFGMRSRWNLLEIVMVAMMVQKSKCAIYRPVWS